MTQPPSATHIPPQTADQAPSSSTRPVATAELSFEIQTFFARQIRLLYARELEEYVNTFTEDGALVLASRGESHKGRQTMLAGLRRALPHYQGVVVRHWFDKFLIEPQEDGSIHVTYYALISRTDSAGTVEFEPTFTVTEVLVRENGELKTQERVVARDTPFP